MIDIESVVLTITSSGLYFRMCWYSMCILQRYVWWGKGWTTWWVCFI